MLRDRYTGWLALAAAEGKARTAASWCESTSTVAARVNKPDSAEQAIKNQPGVVTIGGGMPINAAGQMVGAIGAYPEHLAARMTTSAPTSAACAAGTTRAHSLREVVFIRCNSDRPAPSAPSAPLVDTATRRPAACFDAWRRHGSICCPWPYSLFLLMFVCAEIVWRMMFEYFIAYLQIRDALAQRQAHGLTLQPR
ncbi:heme-binding protein [Thiomonas sp.]